MSATPGNDIATNYRCYITVNKLALLLLLWTLAYW